MGRTKAVLPIHSRLHVLRAEQRMSQEALAEAIGVTRATINAIESGDYNPSLDLAFRISRYFGKGIEDVFFIEEERSDVRTQRKAH